MLPSDRMRAARRHIRRALPPTVWDWALAELKTRGAAWAFESFVFRPVQRLADHLVLMENHVRSLPAGERKSWEPSLAECRREIDRRCGERVERGLRATAAARSCPNAGRRQQRARRRRRSAARSRTASRGRDPDPPEAPDPPRAGPCPASRLNPIPERQWVCRVC